MPVELFARIILYLTELGVALLLSYLLWHFCRIYRQSYIYCWFQALLAFAVYQLAVVVRYTQGLSWSAVDPLLNLIAIIASYSFAVLLLQGMLNTRQKSSLLGRLSGIKLGLCITFVGLFSVLPFLLWPSLQPWQTYFQFHLRILIIGLLLLVAGVGLWQVRIPSLGQSLAALILAAWALLYIFIGVMQLIDEQSHTLFWLALSLKCVELILLISLGFALLIWLQENERSTNVELAEKTRYLDKHDQLTGAYNREALLAMLQQHLHQYEHKPLYLLMLGLDKFKNVNETVGLKQGDQILRQLTERFEQSIIKPALIARTGGDIFALALTDIASSRQLDFTLQHLRQQVSKVFHLTGGPVRLTCSMGIASFPADACDAETLVQKANIAFHQAKRLQLDWFSYQAGMEEESTRLINWESELLQAMEHNQFVLFFQPQLSLVDNKLEAFEVLIRWQHPEQGLLMPGQFLPLVDQLGLSHQLDIWVLGKAVKAISNWEQQGLTMPLAVNMSPLHFQQEGLKQEIQQMLQQHHVSPALLELEITENTAMQDMDKGSNHVIELQQMGIRVSIDDFGTGYSSLAYLRRMPIDKIKIDRSFVQDMADNESDLMIVRTMIQLAHGLGKRILAEGVETDRQLQLLRNMGCNAVQGYFIARPLSEPDAIKFVRQSVSS